MKNILWFLWSPTKHTENIKNLLTKNKVSLTVSITLAYVLTSVGELLLGPIWQVFPPKYFVWAWFVYLITQIIILSLVFIFWKIFKSKAKFLDIFTVFSVAQIPNIVLNTILLLWALAWSSLFVLISYSGILSIITGLWLIILVIYWVSIIGEISKFKAAVTILVSFVLWALIGITLLGAIWGLLLS